VLTLCYLQVLNVLTDQRHLERMYGKSQDVSGEEDDSEYFDVDMEAGSDYGDSGEEEIVTTDFEYYLNSKTRSDDSQESQSGQFTVDNGNSSQCKNTKTLCKIVNFDPDSLFLSNATQVLTLKRANGSDVELEVTKVAKKKKKKKGLGYKFSVTGDGDLAAESCGAGCLLVSSSDVSERLTEFAATDFEKSEAPKSGNKVKKKSPKHGRKVERV